ncbi:MAG: hypothetical protein M0P59_08350 [Gallionella sp.]|jgi:hypothetical protein|nr:hypothetical protein [Gallionella sp.]MCK9354158.1 hypothetical protein [Gallionella sp.]
MKREHLPHRHSGAGRNPAAINIPRSGQNHDLVLLRKRHLHQLDSGLRRNDEK